MPIHAPGTRFRGHRILGRKKGKRTVGAPLSLTAMVDMFTVLVIFLLQNFDPQTNAVLYLSEKVDLPSAEKVKDLQPAVIVSISETDVLVDNQAVMSLQTLRQQSDWMLKEVFQQVQLKIQQARAKEEQSLTGQLRQNLQGSRPSAVPAWSKVTVQADRAIDFLSIKKVLYTITEAGAGEINFAVTKLPGA
jgi:biopolymer transport protein ExbD